MKELFFPSAYLSKGYELMVWANLKVKELLLEMKNESFNQNLMLGTYFLRMLCIFQRVAHSRSKYISQTEELSSSLHT